MVAAVIGGCSNSTLFLSPKGLEQAGSAGAGFKTLTRFSAHGPRPGLIVAIWGLVWICSHSRIGRNRRGCCNVLVTSHLAWGSLAASEAHKREDTISELLHINPESSQAM